MTSDDRTDKRRSDEMDLATLKLERRDDGQLWLKHDGDSDPWYEAAVKNTKPTNGNDKSKGAAADKGTADGKGAADGEGKSEDADGHVAVRIAPCFPWSRAGRYVSLRTSKDKEIALIPDLGELSDETRRLIEEALAEIGFVLEITRVESIRTEVEIRNWTVQTRQGPFMFQTKLDEWPDPLDDGNLVLRDVAGNLFLIPDPTTLDAQSRKLLWPFVG